MRHSAQTVVQHLNKFMNFVRTQNRYYNGGGIYIILVIDFKLYIYDN